MRIPFRTAALGALTIIALVAPATSFAATSRPACTLRVSTPAGSVTTRKSMDVPVASGETVVIEWEARNAQSAATLAGVAVPVIGSSTLVAAESARFSYKFKGGSRSVTCVANLKVAQATIRQVGPQDSGSRVTLSGTLSNAKGARVVVARAGEEVVSAKAQIKRNHWELAVRERLPDGEYAVAVYGTAGLLRDRELARGSFRIGAARTTLSATPVPLLFGGQATLGTSVPVAYVKLVNTGALPAAITGFDLIQNGTAPSSAVIGFTTSDDKGGSLSTFLGSQGGSPFQGNKAFVPLPAVLAPGQLRIFTIKAMIGTNTESFVSLQLKIDVSGIRTDGTVTGVFPMRGTAWTLSY